MRYFARISYTYADGSLSSSQTIEGDDLATFYAQVVGTVEALTNYIGTVTDLVTIDRETQNTLATQGVVVGQVR